MELYMVHVQRKPFKENLVLGNLLQFIILTTILNKLAFIVQGVLSISQIKGYYASGVSKCFKHYVEKQILHTDDNG